MANSYKWAITALRGFADGTVTDIEYALTATDGERVSSPLTGTVILRPIPPSDPSFVPLGKVTEDLAISWVQAVIGNRVADMQAQLDADIAAQKAPVIAEQPAQEVVALAASFVVAGV